MVQPVYTASATATGGREGNVKSSDGVLNIEVRNPKEMGGQDNDYTNPEQLFAAGYAACFQSALMLVMGKAKVQADTTVKADVGIGPNGSGGYGLVVTLTVSLKGLEQQKAEELVTTAHAVCPYSNAIKGNVDVTLNTTVS